MSTKKLFDKGKSYKVLSSVDPATLGLDAESFRNIEAQAHDKNRFVPNVNFASASNFVRYGSAKKYYTSAFDRITNEYPYDGSSAEKQEFYNSSSYLDLHILQNEYPTTTGYASFGITGDAAGLGATAPSHFEDPSVAPGQGGWNKDTVGDRVDHIDIYGGPHTSSNGMIGKSIHSEFSASNIYDSDIYDTEGVLSLGKRGTRESNLKFDLSRGVTTEFWINFGSDWTGHYLLPDNQVIYDQHNGALSSSADYGRLMIWATSSVHAGGENPIRVHLASGSNVWDIGFGGTTVTTSSLKSTWNHIALSFVSSSVSEQLEAKFYFNGDLLETKVNTTITSFGEVTGDLKGRIAGGQHPVSGVVQSANVLHQTNNAFCQLSASMDEFRYWKVERTHEEIAKNYFRHVDGGTNSDIANTELGVYFKFNEGVTSDATTDSTVLDYSGRISNGTWKNYPGTSGDLASRNTGSAIVSASAASYEVEDPIIYSHHPTVSSTRSDFVLSGSAYDYQNNSSIYYSLPSWIIEEEEEKGGELLNLTQIIGSYFDTLHSQIQELPNLKNINYASSSYKPHPFSNRLLESSGLFAPEIFVDASVLEQFRDQSETRLYDKDLSEIKNLIYQNIYNNLVYIYKSKGTEKSFRNVIRCYGVDDELIKINLYGNNVTHKLRDNFRSSVTKKRFANFNHPTRFGATITHQTSSANANTLDFTYLSCSSNASTAEIELIFPKKFKPSDENYFSTEFLSSSIFGYHRVKTTLDQQDYSGYSTSTDRSLQVYAVRPFKESNDAFFVLENPNQSIFLKSDTYQNIYDDTRWNLAVRTYLDKKDQSEKVSGSSGTAGEANVVLELFGVNTELGVVKNQFTLSTTLAQSSNNNGYLSNPRRYYIGANRTNFTASVVTNSDVKATSLRHWNSFLNDSEVISHARNTNSYGVDRPHESAFLYDTDLINSKIPKIETLALHWNLGDLTGSDTRGEFLVNDFSSGSIGKRTRYSGDFGHSVGNQYTGRGFYFPTSSTDSISIEYVQTAVQSPPEVVTSDDMTKILEFDDETFTRDSRTINHFFAIEKSMYQTISEEMLNMFSTIIGFNNLIGEPVNKYRQEYKDLNNLRSLFFENVENIPDLDKYVDFYRWIDSSLSIILRQLIPASANTSEDVRTMVESHVLERAKYEHKYPTIQLGASKHATGLEIAGSIGLVLDRTISGLSDYRFKQPPLGAEITSTGHAAATGHDEFWAFADFFWDDASVSGGSTITEARMGIIQAKRSAKAREAGRIVRISMESDVVNHASKFGAGRRVIHGGTNLPADHMPRGLVSDTAKVDPNRTIAPLLNTPSGRVNNPRVSEDVVHPMEKKFLKAQTEVNTFEDDYMNRPRFDVRYIPLRIRDGAFQQEDGYDKPIVAHPSLTMAGFQQAGYAAGNEEQYSAVHTYESYVLGGEIPMQSPFTEKFVGGFASRHTDINSGTDTERNRAESYSDNFKDSNAFRYVAYGHSAFQTFRPKDLISRNVVAKRPVNIENIQITTASLGSLGNYTNIREVVQVAGKTGGDSQFVRNEGVEVTSLTSSVISGIVDRQMQFLSSSGHMIINRFSAPGGPDTSHGSLDTATTQKSVYNALPYRNLLVRTPLTNLLTASTAQFGFRPGVSPSPTDDTPDNLANYHKIHRNTRYRIEHSNQYSGDLAVPTTASVNDNGFVTRPIPQSDLQYAWLTGSAVSVEPGGEITATVGRMLGYAPRDFKVQINPLSDQGSHFVNAIMFNSQSHHRSNSGENLMDSPSRLSINVRDPVSASSQFLGFPLGADVGRVNSQYMKIEINPNQNIIDQALHAEISGITPAIFYNRGYVYGYSTWKQIRGYEHPVAQALRESHTISVLVPDKQSYDTAGKVLPAQRYGRFKQFRESPIISKYKPIVQAIGDYDIASSYGNNLNFYSSQELNENYAPKHQEEQMYDRVKDLYNDFVGLSYEEAVYPAERNVYSNTIRERKEYNNIFWHSDRATRNERRQRRHSLYTYAATSHQGSADYVYSLWSLDDLTGSGATVEQDVHADGNDPSSFGFPGELQNYNSQGHFGEIGQLTASALYAHKHWVRTSASVVAPSGLELTFASPAASGTFGGIAIGNGNALWQAGEMAGRISRTGLAFEASQREPTHHSYQDFARELRLLGKDYSVIPEYNISNHIEYHVVDRGGDFTSEVKELFAVPMTFAAGTSHSAQQAYTPMGKPRVSAEASSMDDDFYNVYTNSDFLKYFDVVKSEHEGVAKEKALTLTCEGLIRFLPYNGFYPSERTLQMAAQFSSSYEKHVNYQGTHGSNNMYRLRTRPFFETMFAPGVVYNSIKSGIGVPYPVLTGSALVQEIEAGVYALSASGDTIKKFKYIDFEAAIEPEKYLANLPIHDAHPHPSASLNVTASWNGQGDPLYRMMASNFFAECAEFFLPQGNMTTITSLPESDARFGNATSGSVYAMRLKMYRSMNRARTFPTEYELPQDDPTQTDLHETFTMYSRPSAFYPAVSGRGGATTTAAFVQTQHDGTYAQRVMDSYSGYNWTGTPPYYHGQAWLDIQFTATETKKYKLEEILGSIGEGLNLRFDRTQAYGNDAGFLQDAAATSGVPNGLRANTINLSDVLITDGRASVKSVEYDPVTGDPIKVSDDPLANHTSWVIQPKWETPMFNFADSLVSLEDNITVPTYGSESVARGMWHQFGLPGTSEKGIFLQATDVPQEWLDLHPNVNADNYNNGDVKSLVDLLGIDQSPRKLGQVANSKEVSEAVVAVPFFQDGSTKKFFEIPDQLYNDAREGRLDSGNSVSEMIEKMSRYVFPPTMDFLTNREITPFAMYIFEFTHVFDQNDLIHIWQNLAPRQDIKRQAVSVTHSFSDNELLGDSMPEKLQWMVFKVKKKAVKNYFSKVASKAGDSLDDKRYKFEFEIAGRTLETPYSYNWPYDFFSLVELVKVGAKVEFQAEGEEGKE